MTHLLLWTTKRFGIVTGVLIALCIIPVVHSGQQTYAQVRAQICIANMDAMPTEWKPHNTLKFKHIKSRWTKAEEEARAQAVSRGLDEMIEFMVENPARVSELWDNSVEAFIDTAYGVNQNPLLTQKSIEVALKHLKILAQPYLGDSAPQPTCYEVSTYLTLAVYAQNLTLRVPKSKVLAALRGSLVRQTNEALAKCTDLKTLLGFDPRVEMSKPNAKNEDVYSWVMWSINFIDALSNSDLNMPAGTEKFIADTWRYLSTYPIPLARDHANGMNNLSVYDGAYLATHAAYMPTGYGRHLLQVDDAPWLYRYIRENYYAALELGELDLFAEFVDLLRQYGCTEESDAQLRHGSRYLLHLYEKADRRWLNHRESYEFKKISDYDALHKPWTAIAGLRVRGVEQLTEGSYGFTFQIIMKKHLHTKSPSTPKTSKP